MMPELAKEELLRATLNMMTCPFCGVRGEVYEIGRHIVDAHKEE